MIDGRGTKNPCWQLGPNPKYPSHNLRWNSNKTHKCSIHIKLVKIEIGIFPLPKYIFPSPRYIFLSLIPFSGMICTFLVLCLNHIIQDYSTLSYVSYVNIIGPELHSVNAFSFICQRSDLTPGIQIQLLMFQLDSKI